eukprot:GHUV01040514.1.p1 GENE.GHUV01040514.1~~GHUV01040514.1.p1  ORF type:complete len:141 (+),score=34.67 GHUV01040514.1:223-645(+)
MTFTLAANVSKSGWVIYAPRNATDPAPTAADVLLAFSSHNPALANFTASLGVPTAGVVTTGTQCVADGDQLVVYAVAQDNEGQYAGRQNNTSPLVRCAKVVSGNGDPACIIQSCLTIVSSLAPPVCRPVGAHSHGTSIPR